jgi:hypothetical protein
VNSTVTNDDAWLLFRRLLPKLGRLIATGTLEADHGKTKLTTGRQPTHTTWWPDRDVDRASLFTIAAEEG